MVIAAKAVLENPVLKANYDSAYERKKKEKARALRQSARQTRTPNTQQTPGSRAGTGSMRTGGTSKRPRMYLLWESCVYVC